MLRLLRDKAAQEASRQEVLGLFSRGAQITAETGLAGWVGRIRTGEHNFRSRERISRSIDPRLLGNTRFSTFRENRTFQQKY